MHLNSSFREKNKHVFGERAYELKDQLYDGGPISNAQLALYSITLIT